jgi:hypothetical protein
MIAKSTPAMGVHKPASSSIPVNRENMDRCQADWRRTLQLDNFFERLRLCRRPDE